jgi:hypothetical protein
MQEGICLLFDWLQNPLPGHLAVSVPERWHKTIVSNHKQGTYSYAGLSMLRGVLSPSNHGWYVDEIMPS